MSFWTLESLRAAAGGVWLARGAGDAPPAMQGVSIDSRTVRPGQVFIAIAGPNHDGHAFVELAVKGGCPLVIVERPTARLPDSVAVLKVESARQALVRLASAYRRSMPRLKVVGVTGSCGKTTTVRLIHAVLSQKLRGSAPLKSFNNDIGLPLTLLGAQPSDQYVVCELGTNAPGEIEYLARICQPDVGVITMIGHSHLEKLGSIEGVAAEKASMLSHLAASGLALLPSSAPMLSRYVPQDVLARSVWFGAEEEAELRASDVVSTERGVEFTINERVRFGVPLIGEHNAVNATAAIGVGRRLGLDDEAIRQGLLGVVPAEMRLGVQRLGAVTVLNDVYNANTESMQAALRALKAWHERGRRVAILGDMLELGAQTTEQHSALGQWIAHERPADLVILVGDHVQHTRDQAAASGSIEVLLLSDEEGVWDAIAGHLRPGDVVLVKASRSSRLERAIVAIEQRFGANVVVAPLRQPTGTAGD